MHMSRRNWVEKSTGYLYYLIIFKIDFRKSIQKNLLWKTIPIIVSDSGRNLHRQNMALAQLPQPTRPQAGKPEEFDFQPGPTPQGELIGAISLLHRPGTLSAGCLISPLFSSAFDRAFDHLQLIRATLIFKMEKDL